MTPDKRQALRKKHQPVFQNIGRAGDVNYCEGCKGPTGTLINLYPCEVIDVLNALDEALISSKEK